MQLLTLKPQFPREVAFYQAHVRSEEPWEETAFLGRTLECSAAFSLLVFPKKCNISSDIDFFLAKSCSVVCRMWM